MNYDEALNYIHSLQKFGSRPGLERVTALLCAVNNPQNKLKFIHIAGTNGKGSVSSMISSVLQKAGYKTGLFISPYITDFRERIQVNGEFIDKIKLAEYTELLVNTGIEVTEFEFVTALAFLYFANNNCDVVVLEVGMGGRFDATNVIKNPLCSVITSISLDHTGVLGDTISKIAYEKCGIIKDGCKTVSIPEQPLDAMDVILSSDSNVIVPKNYSLISQSFDATEFIYNGIKYKTNLLGRHQMLNAVTAIEVLNICGLKVSEKDICDGLQNVVHPARLEVIKKDPLILLDGAHNPAGAKTLCDFVRDKNCAAIMGIMADKDSQGVLELTAPLFSEIYTVTVKENSRSMSADELALKAKKYNNKVYACNSYSEALKNTVDKGVPTVVFGSLYLAGGIRPLLLDR